MYDFYNIIISNTWYW